MGARALRALAVSNTYPSALRALLGYRATRAALTGTQARKRACSLPSQGPSGPVTNRTPSESAPRCGADAQCSGRAVTDVRRCTQGPGPGYLYTTARYSYPPWWYAPGSIPPPRSSPAAAVGGGSVVTPPFGEAQRFRIVTTSHPRVARVFIRSSVAEPLPRCGK